MQTTTLPNTDLNVSRIAFGCWGITTDFHWGEREESDSIAAIHTAIDRGVNFFDTAEVYGNGESERLLKKALEGRRDQLVIASKPSPARMSKDGIIAACEESLQRLGTDYLDLYQTHWTDRSTPLEESWSAMQSLKQQGKVRHIGVCNMGVEDLSAVMAIEKPITNQLPYNLIWRTIEPAILPLCRQNEVGVLVYSPLMHGMLADKYRSAAEVPDGRARSRHFSTERELARHGECGCEAETFAALDAIREISAKLGRSMADVALAWLGAQQGITSLIVGVKNPTQLEQNISAFGTPLDDAIVAELNAATDALSVALGDNPDMWDGGENSRYR